MTLSETMEAMMLACFSLGWYWSIFAMMWCRRPYGKSAVFVSFTIVGYLLGLGAKLYEWQMGGALSYLTVLYMWNLVVTLIDLSLVVHLTRKTKMGLTVHGIPSAPFAADYDLPLPHPKTAQTTIF